MKVISCASTVGSLTYAILCIREHIYFVIPVREHWTTVEHILEYLKTTRGYMLAIQA